MTTESWPTTPGAKVVARFANVASDGADPDTLPDWAPKVGVEVRFVPSIKGPMVYDQTGMKIIMEVAAVTGVMDESGYLKQKNTGQTLYLAPTNDPHMTKTGWVWTAAWDTGSVVFATPSMGEVNLADFITAPAVDATRQWIERIPELVDAVGDVSVELAAAVGAGEAAVTAAGEAADSASAAATSATTATSAADSAVSNATAAQEARTGAEVARDSTIQVANSIAITADATDVDPGTPADVNVTGEAPQYHFGFEVPRGRDAYIESATPPTDTSMLWLDTTVPSLPETGSPFELRGYGMPNGVVSAPTGTYYTDVVGTNGAWRWLKTSGTGTTGWVVVHGDTGKRVHLPPGYRDGQFRRLNGFILRRTGNACALYIAGIIDPGSMETYVGYLPIGLRPDSLLTEMFATTGGIRGSAAVHASGTLEITGNNTSYISLILTWTTSDPWPTTLPGTAA